MKKRDNAASPTQVFAPVNNFAPVINVTAGLDAAGEAIQTTTRRRHKAMIEFDTVDVPEGQDFLAAYQPQLQEAVAAGMTTSAIWRKLRELGYTGNQNTLGTFLHENAGMKPQLRGDERITAQARAFAEAAIKQESETAEAAEEAMADDDSAETAPEERQETRAERFARMRRERELAETLETGKRAIAAEFDHRIDYFRAQIAVFQERLAEAKAEKAEALAELERKAIEEPHEMHRHHRARASRCMRIRARRKAIAEKLALPESSESSPPAVIAIPQQEEARGGPSQNASPETPLQPKTTEPQVLDKPEANSVPASETAKKRKSRGQKAKSAKAAEALDPKTITDFSDPANIAKFEEMLADADKPVQAKIIQRATLDNPVPDGQDHSKQARL